MANSKKFDPTKIHFSDFHILKGNIDSPFGFDKEKIKNHNFSVGFDMSFNTKDKLVKADFVVEISTISDETQKEEAKGMFHFVFIFFVENLEELVALKTDLELKVEGVLANSLSAITYSTARGILITRFQGTALDNFILPVVNPGDLLKK